ncbi:LuxR C-terminal-related transcriptional regulator [Streptomyces sp. NPDC006482]|uniref:LuxR C-terminal-related transcriptional regulator n=1 Tax=unclassified Streptomyces TaxID=2593676 RepID=UPI0022518FCA|nr:LuxR C-terminal-related transcriptional regulator [Streptomyces sp. NBC_00094]MCX5393614.1 LuxR C-terminal-related transcriptional regulator [Streptomyces sp. NBC_00094]
MGESHVAFVVELVFRGSETDRLSFGEAHRAYWKRMAARGLLLGGGPWRDGTGEFLVCEAPDRRTLLRVLYADPYAQAQVVGELRVREWNAVMGHVVLAGLERSTGGAGTHERIRGGVPAPVAALVPSPTRIVPPRPREGLTAHERRIATMMLDGLTNKQIAESFTVSTRAVELHITRIYRKLDIRRRAQLAAAIGRFESVLVS